MMLQTVSTIESEFRDCSCDVCLNMLFCFNKTVVWFIQRFAPEGFRLRSRSFCLPQGDPNGCAGGVGLDMLASGHLWPKAFPLSEQTSIIKTPVYKTPIAEHEHVLYAGGGVSLCGPRIISLSLSLDTLSCFL